MFQLIGVDDIGGKEEGTGEQSESRACFANSAASLGSIRLQSSACCLMIASIFHDKSSRPLLSASTQDACASASSTASTASVTSLRSTPSVPSPTSASFVAATCSHSSTCSACTSAAAAKPFQLALLLLRLFAFTRSSKSPSSNSSLSNSSVVRRTPTLFAVTYSIEPFPAPSRDAFIIFPATFSTWSLAEE
eukprot:CAMPEP_0119340724 /NCGR_PEP_ID=MMETSP1333-20130426/100911_1 /TAXON_ID=418940 /ORGANISM="Scyphosphaera apsteinii, Strain RCC1455" /LENGTH=191 /DNA_ID=CAMNT_0007352535 /DNA_START=71 /DNA_END=644 /DNA_ORIENTATION=-